jgi:DNA-binding XRE family transcriptional regulator
MEKSTLKSAQPSYYEYPTPLLEGVKLSDGFSIETTPYGEAVWINDEIALEQAVVEVLLLKPGTLSGTKVRAIRRAAQWTQQELAEKLGIGRQTIVRWEREEDGSGEPSIAESFAIRWFAANAILQKHELINIRPDLVGKWPESIIFSKQTGVWRCNTLSSHAPMITATMRALTVPARVQQGLQNPSWVSQSASASSVKASSADEDQFEPREIFLSREYQSPQVLETLQ